VITFYKKLNIGGKVFDLKPVSEEDIEKLLRGFETSKAPGIDNLSGIFLRDGSEILCASVAKLVNLSIALSYFPNQCRMAKLVPLY
jgi:hypothetical protein